MSIRGAGGNGDGPQDDLGGSDESHFGLIRFLHTPLCDGALPPAPRRFALWANSMSMKTEPTGQMPCGPGPHSLGVLSIVAWAARP